MERFSHFQAARASVLPVASEEKDLICIDADHAQLCPGVARSLPSSYFFSGSGVCKGCHLMRLAGTPPPPPPCAPAPGDEEGACDTVRLSSSLAPRHHPLIARQLKKRPREEARPDDVILGATQGSPYLVVDARPDPEEEFALLAVSRTAASARKRVSRSRVDLEDPTNVARFTVPLVSALLEQPFAKKTRTDLDLTHLAESAARMGYQTMKEFHADVVRTFKRALKRLSADSIEGEMVRALRDYFAAIYTTAARSYEAGEDCYLPACAGCEQTGGAMIVCEGSCLRSFHFSCVGLSSAPPEEDKWMCPACTRGLPVLHWDAERKDYYEFAVRSSPQPVHADGTSLWDPIKCQFVVAPKEAPKGTLGDLVTSAKVWSMSLNRSAPPPQ